MSQPASHGNEDDPSDTVEDSRPSREEDSTPAVSSKLAEVIISQTKRNIEYVASKFDVHKDQIPAAWAKVRSLLSTLSPDFEEITDLDDYINKKNYINKTDAKENNTDKTSNQATPSKAKSSKSPSSPNSSSSNSSPTINQSTTINPSSPTSPSSPAPVNFIKFRCPEFRQSQCLFEHFAKLGFSTQYSLSPSREIRFKGNDDSAKLAFAFARLLLSPDFCEWGEGKECFGDGKHHPAFRRGTGKEAMIQPDKMEIDFFALSLPSGSSGPPGSPTSTNFGSIQTLIDSPGPTLPPPSAEPSVEPSGIAPSAHSEPHQSAAAAQKATRVHTSPLNENCTEINNKNSNILRVSPADDNAEFFLFELSNFTLPKFLGDGNADQIRSDADAVRVVHILYKFYQLELRLAYYQTYSAIKRDFQGDGKANPRICRRCGVVGAFLDHELKLLDSTTPDQFDAAESSTTPRRAVNRWESVANKFPVLQHCRNIEQMFRDKKFICLRSQVSDSEMLDVLKQDVDVLKQDVGVLKQDVGVLKQDVSTIKQGMVVLDKKLDKLTESMSEFMMMQQKSMQAPRCRSPQK